ncbi:MAG: HTTM domain-containing protein [Bacteroidota bacterium]
MGKLDGSKIVRYWNRPMSAAPLATFRICFGVLMLVSLLRFWYLGWIEERYLTPTFHFSYWGFSWVKPIGEYTYGLFLLAGLATLAIIAGYRYRLAMITFFLSFTYIELMDKTTYLNHYYFISVVSFLLIFLPAHHTFSMDDRRLQLPQKVPQWTIDTLKLLLFLVYFYAGLGKLNTDWLVAHEPLNTWLPTRYDLPLIGWMLEKSWAPGLFSWGGAIYDLSIPFLLWYDRTRPLAFLAVIGFHLMTALLFPIGMFPYIMMGSTLIFCSVTFHERIIAGLRQIFTQLNLLPAATSSPSSLKVYTPHRSIPILLAVFLAFQVLIPLRAALYPGELFWTEQGFRFSWRVMLIEKAGYANFKMVDRRSGKSFYINNGDFLTAIQEKEMSKQPDFILEYAHYLGDHFRRQGWTPSIYVESVVALNGRSSQPFVDPTVDLLEVEDTWAHKDWILPLGDEIWGL